MLMFYILVSKSAAFKIVLVSYMCATCHNIYIYIFSNKSDQSLNNGFSPCIPALTEKDMAPHMDSVSFAIRLILSQALRSLKQT